MFVVETALYHTFCLYLNSTKLIELKKYKIVVCFPLTVSFMLLGSFGGIP